MKSVTNWISYLHANSWIFGPFLTILIKFKIKPCFSKILIPFPSLIWRSYYRESCSFLENIHRHILYQNFQARECTFWICQSFKRFEFCWIWIWIKSNRAVRDCGALAHSSTASLPCFLRWPCTRRPHSTVAGRAQPLRSPRACHRTLPSVLPPRGTIRQPVPHLDAPV
jgi:hypothetical protein